MGGGGVGGVVGPSRRSGVRTIASKNAGNRKKTCLAFQDESVSVQCCVFCGFLSFLWPLPSAPAERLVVNQLHLNTWKHYGQSICTKHHLAPRRQGAKVEQRAAPTLPLADFAPSREAIGTGTGRQVSVPSRIDGKLRGQDCPRYGSWAYRAQSCARSVRRRVRMPRPTRRRLDAQGRAGPPDPPSCGRVRLRCSIGGALGAIGSAGKTAELQRAERLWVRSGN